MQLSRELDDLMGQLVEGSGDIELRTATENVAWLRKRLEYFALTALERPGVNREVIFHIQVPPAGDPWWQGPAKKARLGPLCLDPEPSPLN